MVNFGTGVRASILKPTPIIYMALKKYDLFIYIIVRNVDAFICCPFRFYIAVHVLFAVYTQGLDTNNAILFQFGSLS